MRFALVVLLATALPVGAIADPPRDSTALVVQPVMSDSLYRALMRRSDSLTASEQRMLVAEWNRRSPSPPVTLVELTRARRAATEMVMALLGVFGTIVLVEAAGR